MRIVLGIGGRGGRGGSESLIEVKPGGRFLPRRTLLSLRKVGPQCHHQCSHAPHVELLSACHMSSISIVQGMYQILIQFQIERRCENLTSNQTD